MFLQKYNKWIDSKLKSEKIKNELKAIKSDKEKEDRFYKDLKFDTGGLRGAI